MSPAGSGGRRNLGSTELKRQHRAWRRRTQGRVGLVLDAVQNPFNLGSIARLAGAYKVERGWVVGAGPTPFAGSKVQKTAMGTERLVPWSAVEHTHEATDSARAAGFRLVGIELGEGARPLFDLDLRGALCLVVGHEERGLSSAALKACDSVGFLPLLGRVGSLNVATATGIALYELRRQDWMSETAEETAEEAAEEPIDPLTGTTTA